MRVQRNKLVKINKLEYYKNNKSGTLYLYSLPQSRNSHNANRSVTLSYLLTS